MHCYLCNREGTVCMHTYVHGDMYTGFVVGLFFTTCTAALLEGRTSKLETAEGWRRGSLLCSCRAPWTLWGPVDPELRLGLKPEDTGKVKQKSNLGPMLQFQPGKSRIFPRAEIIQIVSKNT